MIVPSVDISDGAAVQLVEGEQLAVAAGDPRPLVERFGVVGEVAVIDIDAARGEGDNAALIAELCKRAQVRVGGGIRDRATAERWLDAGAQKVIVGTAAGPDLLDTLPADNVIVALDSRNDEVVTHGWRRRSGRSLWDRISELRELCGGFLVTFVEREGRLGGTDLARAARVVKAAGTARVTIAGGVTTSGEILQLDQMGADAQVGMALYTGQIELAEAFAAPLVTERDDGLWPTLVADETGQALGLAWSSRQTLAEAIDTSSGIYHSRRRGRWVKGETSGATQRLLRVDADCDRDTLRFTVEQEGWFCHLGTRGCWGEDAGISRLFRRLADIAEQRQPGNTVDLLDDPGLLSAKLREEAVELGEAMEPDHVAAEVADILYFAAVKAAGAGVGVDVIERELSRREQSPVRRPMVRKDPIDQAVETGETS